MFVSFAIFFARFLTRRRKQPLRVRDFLFMKATGVTWGGGGAGGGGNITVPGGVYIFFGFTMFFGFAWISLIFSAFCCDFH